LLGFGLLAFQHRRQRTIWIWVGLFMLISFIVLALERMPSAGLGNVLAPLDLVGRARYAYLHPSYLKVLSFQTIFSPVFFAMTLLVQGPSVMALFLVGLLVGRAGFFERLAENRKLLRCIFWAGLGIGVTGNSLLLLDVGPWLASLGLTVGAPALAAAYICGLALLSLHVGGGRLLAPFSAVGRMALSNYVLQSLVCSVLFGGFALGLYEKVGSAALEGIAVLIFGMQVLVSGWWLRRFRYGPLEWIWRSLTYRAGK
jgi:uncharacterized protein